jgi:hypothetical protein
MKRVGWVTRLLASALVSVAACSQYSDDPTDIVHAGEEVQVDVAIYGMIDGNDCMHFLYPGEDFPQGKLCNTQSYPVTHQRQITMTLKKGSTYIFRVGRNGQILATKSCQVPTDTYSPGALSVEWIGAALRCKSGWN